MTDKRSTLSLADIRIWLQALDELAKVFPADARQIQRDLADPVNQIAEYIDMVRNAPPHTLTPFEVWWRQQHARIALSR